MIELFDFIKHIITPDALISFLFVLIGLLIKYVIIPWNEKFTIIVDHINSLKHTDETQFNNMEKNIEAIKKDIQDRGSRCSSDMSAHIINIKKILDKLTLIESNVDNVVSRLERLKDDSKDGKVDLNQQLFSIKQEISDLKTKIEPLTYISRGIK